MVQALKYIDPFSPDQTEKELHVRNLVYSPSCLKIPNEYLFHVCLIGKVLNNSMSFTVPIVKMEANSKVSCHLHVCA